MFKLICITNRKMCGDFLDRAGELYRSGIDVILREKDLRETDYEILAKRVTDVCPDVILHTYTDAARRLGVKKIHLPFAMMKPNMNFEMVGVSVHSAEEAKAAEEMGADYVMAGHIFATDCKKGLAPRGIGFLREIVHSVSIPVYAVGGITPANIEQVKGTGAKGACIMSGFMRCISVSGYIKKFNGIN